MFALYYMLSHRQRQNHCILGHSRFGLHPSYDHRLVSCFGVVLV